MSSGLSSTRSSPIPDLAFDSFRTLSLRDQTLVKRQINSGSFPGNNLDTTNSPPMRPRLHNPNIQQNLLRLAENPNDYVTVHGDTFALSPYTTETLVFWILLSLLIVLVIANSTLTFIVFGSLRLGAGMESIEFLPNLLKFYGDVDLDEVNKLDGIIQGFGNQPMEINAGEDGGKVIIWVHEGTGPSIALDKTGLNFTNIEEFQVTSKSGHPIFSTSTPSLDLPNGVKNLRVRIAKVNRITSAVNSSLELSSSSFTFLKGSEGTRIEGKDILFSADRDIFMKAINGDIILSGRNGIHLYTQWLPLVADSDVTRNQHMYPIQGMKYAQFKLCICMPLGKLFRIEIPVNNKDGGHHKITCNSITMACE